MNQEEVFRFAQLRAPQKVSLSTALIPDSVLWNKNFDEAVAASEITAIREGSPLLVEDLIAVNAGDFRIQYETICNNFHNNTASPRYIKDENVLYSSSWFKGFDALNDWINSNYHSADKNTFVAKFLEYTGSNISEINTVATYKKKIFRVWDNLVAQIIILKKEILREELSQVIKVYEFAKAVNNAAVNPPINQIFNLSNFLIILPKSIFPLPEKANNPLPATPPDNSFDYNQLSATISNYKKAAEELKTVKQYQLHNNYSNDIAVPVYSNFNAEFIPTNISLTPIQPKNNLVSSTNYNEMLSVTTKDIVTVDIKMQSNAVYVDQAIERIEAKVTNLLSAMPGIEVYNNVSVFGGVVNEIKPLCAATLNEDPCGNYIGIEWSNNSPIIESLYVADLKIVNKKLKRYEKGEIAHIENILKNEKRSRKWTKTNRTSETVSLFSEDFSESIIENTTSESTNLSSVSTSIISKDSQFNAGASVTGSYGVVKASISANYSSSNSNTNANTSASNFAKEITTRAQSRIQKRVSVTRATTNFEEIVEQIEQTYDNIGDGNNNVSGIYTWVDKVFECNVTNYGKRLMLELIIPEPASFYIFSKSQPNEATKLPPKPIDPTKLNHPVLKNLEDPTNFMTNPVNKIEYLKWAALYGVKNLDLPPKSKITVSKSFSYHSGSGDKYHVKNEEISIPDGYKAVKAIVVLGSTWGGSSNHFFILNIGKHAITKKDGTNEVALDGETVSVPFSFFAFSMNGYFINFQIECAPTEELINEWNLKAYNAIISKYEKDLEDFNNAIENAAEVFSFDSNGVVGEEVMKNELKKRSIEMLSQQRFESFDSTINKQGENKYPEIDFGKVREDAKNIKFFENAFEWNNMTYEFMPYFWGRKPRWLTLMKFEGADLNFTQFMQAGASRVVIPVRLEYSKTILNYINTGQIAYVFGDFVSPEHHQLLLELRDPVPTINPNEEEKWEIKIPTTQIYLDNPDTALPVYFS